MKWISLLPSFFVLLTATPLFSEKPILDWYTLRFPDETSVLERKDFTIMTLGKNSDVVLLTDWTLGEVGRKREEGYKKVIGWITEPSAVVSPLLDPPGHIQDPHLGPALWIENNLDLFDLILTHNQYLLDHYPEKCKFLHAKGFSTLYDQRIHEKSKLCSHMVSNMKSLEGHLLRWDIAEKYGEYFAACKDGNSTWVEWKDEWLNDFCFSVIVENTQESHYFSEKILECFRAGTVPIYWGCPTIGEFFDSDGIITFDCLEDLEGILKNLSFEEYQKRLPAIRRNFETAGDYPQFHLRPCRHKGYVIIDYTKPWSYSIDRPDVMDGIWPYIESYFEPISNYNLVEGEPDISITKKTEEIGATWANGSVYEKHLIHSFYSLLKEKKEKPFVVLDVGAQTGCFTLLSKFFPHSTWYAFEPIREAANELKNNLELNGIKNVSVYEMGISSSSGQEVLKLPLDQHWGVASMGKDPLRFSSYEERAIHCMALDEFAEHHQIDPVDFIKIDVEGWEWHVLTGGEELIAKDRPIILMELNETNMQQCGIKKEQIIQFLEKHQYIWSFISAEDLLCLPNKTPKEKLRNNYKQACTHYSDIYEHLPVLEELATECASVTEIGVRSMVSSWGFLYGLAENSALDRSYLGIDPEMPPFTIYYDAKKLAKGNGINFQFLQKNDMEIEIEPVELLFIDSLHTYCHLTYELEKFSPKVSKYIVMHDTSYPWGELDWNEYLGDYSEYPQHIDRTRRGLWSAVEDFLDQHPEWSLFERRLNNHGLTILKRKAL